MLNENDFRHLKLLYEQLQKKIEYIKTLIQAQDWDGVDAAVQEKDALIKNIVQFEKPRLDDIKEDEFLNCFRLELIELEKNNIHLIQELKDELLKEITNTKHAKRLLNTYEPSTNIALSTVDITQED